MVEAFAKPALPASNSAVPRATAIREVCLLRVTFQLSEELILLCKGYRLRLGSCRFATVFGRGFVLRLYWYTARGTKGSGSLLGQRFTLRLRGERQGGEPDQKHQTHGDAGVAHGFGVAAEDVLGEGAQRERT